jgi:hypothetical protein
MWFTSHLSVKGEPPPYNPPPITSDYNSHDSRSACVSLDKLPVWRFELGLESPRVCDARVAPVAVIATTLCFSSGCTLCTPIHVWVPNSSSLVRRTLSSRSSSSWCGANFVLTRKNLVLFYLEANGCGTNKKEKDGQLISRLVPRIEWFIRCSMNTTWNIE